MKLKFKPEELGVSQDDSGLTKSWAVIKAIDSNYCGDAVVTKTYEKDGFIVGEFFLKSQQ